MFLIVSSLVLAQPCLEDWEFRSRINIDNSGNRELTNFQVVIEVNTNDLINDNKMRFDGGDIQFRSTYGNKLSFWIEPETMNTTTTNIWVQVDTIEANALDSIFLFYGNPSYVLESNGETTFEFFDDFVGSTLNSAKWNTCGGGISSVYGGNLVLTDDVFLTSAVNFSDTVGIVGFLNGLTNEEIFAGLWNSDDEGYSFRYYNQGSSRVTQLKQTDNSGACFSDQTMLSNPADQNLSGPDFRGRWMFNWYENDVELIYPQGNHVGTDNSPQIKANTSIMLGSKSFGSSSSMDWIFARKIAKHEPLTSVVNEIVSVKYAEATSVGNYCVGDEVELFANTVDNAIYRWQGKTNSIDVSIQNPVFSNAQVNLSGTYLLTISTVGGCHTKTDTVDVFISPASEAGNVTSDQAVCYGTNFGTMKVDSYVGDILNWEVSNNGLSSWAFINQVEDTLNFQNSISTKYYRAVVKSGSCETDTTEVIEIAVSDTTIGGNLSATNKSVCAGTNQELLTLYNWKGTINQWEKRKYNETTWTPFVNANNSTEINDILDSTYYRAQVQNGICPPKNSDSILIIAYPQPNISFFASNVCLHDTTQIVNSTSIYSGTINQYLWDFSDGFSSSNTNPRHKYSASGTYQVKMRAISDKGCTKLDSFPVTVNPLPTAQYTYQSICENDLAVFSSTSTISQGSFSTTWDIDGQASFNNQNVVNYTFNNSGLKNIKLLVESAEGCKDSILRMDTVHPRAVVNFVTDTVCFGNSTIFNNTSTVDYGSVNYNWNFGDGIGSDNTPYTSYTYPNAGKYRVTLLATTEYGCVDLFRDSVWVYETPIASYTVSDNCFEIPSEFTNTTSNLQYGNVLYRWNFNDGGGSYAENPSYTFGQPGTYEVEMEVTSTNGCSDVVKDYIEIYSLPTADFSYTPSCEGFDISLVNSSKSGVKFYWDFDDTRLDSTSQPSISYANYGTYQVQLIAETGELCRDTIKNDVLIYDNPISSFLFDTVCDGHSVQFNEDVQLNDAQVVDYLWDFDDNQVTSPIDNPEHQFLNANTTPGYGVNLWVRTNQGCVHDTVIYVRVNHTPVANFYSTDECASDPRTFNNESSIYGNGNLDSYWYFENNSTSVLQNPEYTFLNPGEYPVELIVTTDEGCQDSITKTYTVYPSPSVIASADTTVISQGYSVQLYGSGAELYTWSPILGLDNNLVFDPVATPLETKEYIVTGIDSYGCTNSDTITITVLEEFKVEPYNVITPNGNGKNDTWIIKNIETFENSLVVVYDQWGNEVFSQRNYQNDWGGTNKTDILPDGTYYYTIQFDESERTYKGFLTILRDEEVTN